MVCRWYEVCPIKRFCDEGLLERRWVKEYCLRDNPNCVRRRLEEEGIGHPDNMLPNGEIDERLR